MDSKGGKIRIPQIIPESDEDLRHLHEARARRKIRLERRSARGGQISYSVKWSV